jgi:hypothetical protein
MKSMSSRSPYPTALSVLERTGPAPVAVRAQVLHPLHALVRGRSGQSGRMVGELSPRRDDTTHAVQEPVGRYAAWVFEDIDHGMAWTMQRLPARFVGRRGRLRPPQVHG